MNKIKILKNTVLDNIAQMIVEISGGLNGRGREWIGRNSVLHATWRRSCGVRLVTALGYFQGPRGRRLKTEEWPQIHFQSVHRASLSVCFVSWPERTENTNWRVLTAHFHPTQRKGKQTHKRNCKRIQTTLRSLHNVVTRWLRNYLSWLLSWYWYYITLKCIAKIW